MGGHRCSTMGLPHSTIRSTMRAGISMRRTSKCGERKVVAASLAKDAMFGIGVGMAMPTIRDFASDELKQRFLAPGLRG